MFALVREGRDRYPKYRFDTLFRPLPVMLEVLADFKDAAPVQVANWMESPSGHLAGRRPREVVEQAPREMNVAVVARRRGGLHG